MMENVVSNDTKRAFAEAYEIINHSKKEIRDKISVKFMDILDKYRDLDYISKIDYSKSLENQDIMHETKVILGIVYRDYLCDDEEKQKLLKDENIMIQQIEKERQEKYSVDNLFKDRKASKELQVYDNCNQKHGLFSRILKKIKQFFKR